MLSEDHVQTAQCCAGPHQHRAAGKANGPDALTSWILIMLVPECAAGTTGNSIFVLLAAGPTLWLPLLV